MAKKNSSKTATEKAIQSSEPRLVTFKGWQGVNFVDSPLTWNPLEDFHINPESFNQTDLPANFFMVQNNLNTTDLLGVETRMDSIKLGDVSNLPSGYDRFTGVGCMHKHWLFVVARKYTDQQQTVWIDKIFYKDIVNLVSPENNPWIPITFEYTECPYSPMTPLDPVMTTDPHWYEFKEIGFFEGNMVVSIGAYIQNQGGEMVEDHGLIGLAKVEIGRNDSSISITCEDWIGSPDHSQSNAFANTPLIRDPENTLTLTAQGDLDSSPDDTDPTCPVRVDVCYCYTNRFGSSLINKNNIATIWVNASKANWSSKRYLKITGVPDRDPDNFNLSATGVDYYARENDNIDWVFIGHSDYDDSGNIDYYNWYGNQTDITQWITAQLMVPTDNTTEGPDATHFDCHDSRMYYWGMPSKPYRLWIGGNPGSEFSVARGLGGAWVDIEPGSGYDIKGTAKWKTTSGSNIITIMCGNRNTTKIKRFNLVETNLAFTNEMSYKSYMYEEVSNVVGCNSRWGYGVYDEGLYALNRYGLMLTTMAAEYNNQMKNQKVSDVIEPIFTDVLGKQLSDGRMVCINNVIYIAFSEEDDAADLGNVILCYDTSLKAWYTWTHDQTLNETGDPDKVLHIMAIDSDEYREGLGSITESEVRLYPVTGEQGVNIPPFQVLLESGELAPRQPMQAYWYLQQMEFRFDYFVGDPENPATVLIEGVDYYGRYFQIEKKLNYTGRHWQPVNDNGLVSHHKILPDGPEWTEPVEQRNYTEWIRVDKLVQSVRIRIKGQARFRLTHINAKIYQQADTIGTPYGFDAGDRGYDRRQKPFKIHHYINDYNNLRRAVVS